MANFWDEPNFRLQMVMELLRISVATPCSGDEEGKFIGEMRVTRVFNFQCSTLFAVLGVFVCASSLAQPRSTGDEIAKACTPLVLMSVVSERRVDSSTEVFKAYASWWYFDGATTLEQARKSGFQVDVVYKGVPLSAIWSDDASKKQSARQTWSEIVKQEYRSRRIDAIEEIKRDPVSLERYNDCAASVIRSADDMACFFSAASDRATGWLTVVLRPRTEFRPQRVTSKIANGFVVPDLDKLPARIANEIIEAISNVRDGRSVSLPQGAKTTLDFGGPARAGSWSFRISRLNPNQPLIVSARLANGVSCTEARLEPAPLRTIEWSLWPEAKDWQPTSASFRFFQRKESCGRGVTPMAQNFCLPEADRVVSFDVTSRTGNCGSTIAATERIAPNCVRITANVKGCGHDAVRACKGRGWVDTTVLVSGATPIGERTVARSGAIEKLQSLSFNGRFDYDLPLPSDLKVERWRYKVVITDATTSQQRSITLSDDRPSFTDPVTQQFCNSSVAGPGQATGYVSWSCSLPTIDAHRTLSTVLAGVEQPPPEARTATKALSVESPSPTVLQRIEEKKAPPPPPPSRLIPPML